MFLLSTIDIYASEFTQGKRTVMHPLVHLVCGDRHRSIVFNETKASDNPGIPHQPWGHCAGKCVAHLLVQSRVPKVCLKILRRQMSETTWLLSHWMCPDCSSHGPSTHPLDSRTVPCVRQADRPFSSTPRPRDSSRLRGFTEKPRSHTIIRVASRRVFS